ncbi:MAG: 2-oxoacid:ferredoxin oxidoreductase subunit beta [Candidatus Omnitrophica bacterium]|nr:2-oxoacid:ferredoxin oxidoreductase subunit beta [Candidatus Omnitrophota bacterium]
MALKVQDYKTDVHNDWCPGCGDFGILNAVQQALAEMQLPPEQVLLFSGVGCFAKTPHFVNTYGCHTLHGRSLPFAVGAKLANPDLTVVSLGGDGDGYGIGAGHFLNTGRRNVDLLYLVFDNGVYGLTKGQASPTLKKDIQTKSLPMPNINDAINPLAVALAAGYTFIARGYAYDGKGLRELIKAGINHRGLALLDVLQPCPTYNTVNTKEWYEGLEMDEATGIKKASAPRLYKLEESGYDPVVHNPADPAEISQKMVQAFQKSQEWEGRIPVGVFYQINLPTYHDRLNDRVAALKRFPAAKMPIYEPSTGTPAADISKALEELRVC